MRKFYWNKKIFNNVKKPGAARPQIYLYIISIII